MRIVQVIQIRAGWRNRTGKVERHLARLVGPNVPPKGPRKMVRIIDFKAKRSGAAITLVGKDLAGNPVKLRIEEIAQRAGKIIATASDGSNYELA